MKIKILTCLILLNLASCTFESDDASDFYDLLYVEHNAAKMPVHIHGNIESKVIILVLHGGPGGNGLVYRPGVFKEEIENNYAIAYLDQRAQGMSQGHLDKESTNLTEIVEDVRAVISVIKHKYGAETSVFLMGHSWGGTLGTAYMIADDYQSEVKGWIEVDGAHDFDLLLRAQIRMINNVGSEEIASDRSQDFWAEFIDKAKEVDTLDYSIEDISSLNDLSFKAEEELMDASILRDGSSDYQDEALILKTILFSTNPFTNYFTGSAANGTIVGENNLIETRIADHLNKITSPTLLLWGAYDFVVPPALGHQAYDLINTENKKLVIFQESGHSPMFNEGELFKNELIEFIETYK